MTVFRHVSCLKQYLSVAIFFKGLSYMDHKNLSYKNDSLSIRRKRALKKKEGQEIGISQFGTFF